MNKWFGANGLENAILRSFTETKQHSTLCQDFDPDSPVKWEERNSTLQKGKQRPNKDKLAHDAGAIVNALISGKMCQTCQLCATPSRDFTQPT